MCSTHCTCQNGGFFAESANFANLDVDDEIPPFASLP